MISGCRNQCGRSLLALSFVVRRQCRNVGLLLSVFFAAVPRFTGRVFNDRQGGSVGWLRRVAGSGLFPNCIPTRVMFHTATRTVRVTRKLWARHFGSIVHRICSLAQGSVTSAFTREHIIEATAYEDRETHHASALRGASAPMTSPTARYVTLCEATDLS